MGDRRYQALYLLLAVVLLFLAVRGVNWSEMMETMAHGRPDYPDLLELYRTARMIVVPLINNRYSMGGVVLGEATSLGKPVVLSRVDALRGIDPLESEKCCILVEPENVDELYDAINTLYYDQSARTALGQKARLVARQYFDIDIYVARLSQLFANSCDKETKI